VVGIIRFGIPTGDFSLKVSVHIDSNTSLISKPEKAVTLRIVEGYGWVVDLLVRYGADLYAKNKRGRTPLDVAVGEAKTVLREWARRFKGEATPPPKGYIEIEPLDEEGGRGGANR